jgi:hypothetical protein
MAAKKVSTKNKPSKTSHGTPKENKHIKKKLSQLKNVTHPTP